MRQNPLELLSSGHFHDMPEHYTKRAQPTDNLVIWVLGGRGFARCGRVTVKAQAGDLLVFPKGAPHEYGADPHEPWDIVWAHFDGTAAGEFVAELRRHGPVAVRLGLGPVLHERFFEMVMIDGARTPQARALASCLLWGVLGMIRDSLDRPAEARDAQQRGLAQRLQAYVHAHLDQPIALGDLARQAQVSPRGVTRLFQRLFGVSPIQYVIQQRLSKAASLLAETDLPVKQVAAAVGCRDTYYFYRLFHRGMKKTPRAYREQARGGRRVGRKVRSADRIPSR